MTTPEHHAEAILRAAGSFTLEHYPTETRQAILDAVREAMGPGWLPIESAPRDGADVLIYDPKWPVSTAYWSDSIWASVNNPVRGQGGGWVQEINRSDTFVFSPTHWQPLPLPPSDGGR